MSTHNICFCGEIRKKSHMFSYNKYLIQSCGYIEIYSHRFLQRLSRESYKSIIARNKHFLTPTLLVYLVLMSYLYALSPQTTIFLLGLCHIYLFVPMILPYYKVTLSFCLSYYLITHHFVSTSIASIEFIIYLRGLDMIDRFSTIFYKGDFVFFPENYAPSENESIL